LQGQLADAEQRGAREGERGVALTVAVEERDYLVAYYQKSENALALHGDLLQRELGRVLEERNALHARLQARASFCCPGAHSSP